MIEGKRSTYFIFVDDCGKAFYSEKGYEEHRKQPCSRSKTYIGMHILGS